jgi:predicted aspartyl protease
MDRIPPRNINHITDPLHEIRNVSKFIEGIESDLFNNQNCNEDGYGNNVMRVFAMIPLSEREAVTCPQIQVNVGSRHIRALIDSGSECSLINAELLQQLVDEGLDILSLPISGCVIKGAFESRFQRIKSQVLIDIYIDRIKYEVILLVAPTLTIDIILGMQFLKNYCVNINFEQEYFETKVNNMRQKHVYPGTDGKEATVMSIRTAKYPIADVPVGATGKKEFYDRPDFMAEMCKRFPGYPDVCSDRVNHCRDDSQKYGLSWHEADTGSHSDHVRDSSGDTEGFYAQDALIDVQSVEDADFIGDKEIGDSNPRALCISKCNMIPVSGHIFHAKRDGAYTTKTSCSMPRRPSSQHDITSQDPRDITTEGLRLKTVEAESLSSTQQVELFNILLHVGFPWWHDLFTL